MTSPRHPPSWRRALDALKGASLVDDLARHNPLYYGSARQLAASVNAMDRDRRLVLTHELTAQVLAWARRTPAGRGGSDSFQDWPRVTKDQLRQRPQDFWRNGSVHISASTSGSTGMPVRLRRSLRSIAVEQAFLDEMVDAVFTTVSGRSRAVRVARLRSDPVKDVNDRSPPYGIRTHGGRRLLLSTHHLGQATVEWFYRELVDFRPDVLFTTPGSAETLARLMHGRGFELDLPVLLTSSETLYPAGRGLLQARFGGQLLDYYGLAERVALASSVGDGPYFFNPAYGRVEFLPLGAEDAPPGARAYEIVATGYWNEAMPLVRFQTGDRAIVPADYSPRDMEDAALGLKPVSAIEGRDRVNVVSPRGDIIVGLPHMTKGVRGLLRLQVVQESRTELQFLALVDPQVGELDHAALLENASHWIPSDMNVVIREVDELQRLPSGKTPFVIRRL